MQKIISAAKAKKISAETGSGNNVKFNDMDILDHIEKIVGISQKYGINKCFSRGKRHFDYVTSKLGISPLQAAIFSQFFVRAHDNHIFISEIAESLKCSMVRILKYMNECEELERKKLIRCSRGENGTTYRIPRSVRESLRNFNEFRPEKIDGLSISKFFSAIKRIFEEKSNDELSYEIMKLELLDLINQNMHLGFCRNIIKCNLDENDLILLVCFCHLFGNNHDENISEHDLSLLEDDECDFSEAKFKLTTGKHILMEKKLVEYTNSNGFAEADTWKLSDLAKKELMTELTGQRNYRRNLILSDAIKPKIMYYNPWETGEVNTLLSLLSDENYRKIQDRLDGRGMRKGFACLFSGGPGTGKTETAYQIARETKRNIMMVDISETKSMWFGESEKRIKEIFNTYREAADNSQITPILLFNEADAVIGKRKVFDSVSRAVDQTENTIQNIILQEMETLSGILIATTNLTKNMDDAFERRFLYKITFDKPGQESRLGIWNSLLPDLTEDKAAELAARFELTGGQIENIARKIEVDAILNGSAPSMDIIVQYCKDEIQNSFNAAKRIGFGQESA